MRRVTIGGREIGSGRPVYVVAEMSANHAQSLDRACALVRAAKDAGADAIKLQTYTPDTMTLASDDPRFRVDGTLWHGRRLHDLYAEAFTPWDWHGRLKDAAADAGLDWFSTPFDATAVDFLERLDPPAYKIASFELVDVPLLARVARTAKPVILSTGMATLAEIDEAVSTLRENGCDRIVLLKCTSAYPAVASEMDLLTIPNLAETFDAVVGLSDHSMEIAVPVTAAVLGACLIEKHLTLSRSDGGPDAAFSLEPAEFRSMVDALRCSEQALGSVRYGPSPREHASLAFRRSLFVVEDMQAGDRFTEANVRSIRPSGGLHPRHLAQVIGCAASCAIRRGTPMSWPLVRPASVVELNT